LREAGRAEPATAGFRAGAFADAFVVVLAGALSFFDAFAVMAFSPRATRRSIDRACRAAP
jgi:hypothetical protein